MKKALFDLWQKPHRGCARMGVVVLAVCLATGCSTVSSSLPTAVQDLGPDYKPTNIYRRANALPNHVRRVALLPLTTTSSTPYLEAGVEALEPLVYSELEKTKRFEVIPVTPDQLKQWTGQTGWRTDEALPQDIFKKLAEATGCDAVLFCQLTRYQPYQPLAVGWKFSLVENIADATAPSGMKAQILWSVDEVLDSGEPTVATGARNYYTQHLRNEAPSADASTMLSSPVRFGQYTLGTLLGTLPARSAGGGIFD